MINYDAYSAALRLVSHFKGRSDVRLKALRMTPREFTSVDTVSRGSLHDNRVFLGIPVTIRPANGH